MLQCLADLTNTAAADGDFTAISDALNAVPTALVTISQGSADRNDILMDVTTSNLVKFPGFTSSSLDRSVAENFAEQHTGRKKNETAVLLVIRGKSGRPIEGLSQYGLLDNGKSNQREEIFNKGKKFRVLSYR